ncbi:hypothetical protein HOLleu_04124 [Holothuria leucospilota]|uniref:Ig-like domain-containing protein n=1 Tax=Holothuria leucospilota TaxID=206669 RepID=A0A9Q1HKM2_HOLLE|nr:hypothetical protein HOLleu_04124 [Holothuria leucospilota]
MAKPYADLVWIIVTYHLSVGIKNAKFVESLNSTHLIVSVLTPVVFDCECDWDNVIWIHGSKSLVHDGRLSATNFPGTITYFENKSISFSAVTIQNEGTYQCICEFGQVEEYRLTVEVPPELYISIDYQNITNSTYYLEANKNHTVTCHAYGAKPAVNLTWKKNDEEITAPWVAFNVTVNPCTRYLYDSVATLWIHPEEEQGNLTCTSSSRFVSEEFESRVIFLTYVSPTVSLRVNGHNASEVVYVNIHEEVAVVCTAKRARPAANVTLLINDDILEDSKATDTEYTSESSQVFDTSVYGKFRLDRAVVQVTCNSQGRYGYNDSSVTTTVYTYAYPEVTLSIDGTYIANGTTYINKEDNRLIISCRAHGARTPVILKLDVTGDYLVFYNVSETLKQRKNNSGFDTEEAISLKPRKGKTTIKCISFCQHCREEQSHYVEVETVGKLS